MRVSRGGRMISPRYAAGAVMPHTHIATPLMRANVTARQVRGALVTTCYAGAYYIADFRRRRARRRSMLPDRCCLLSAA